MVRLLQEFPCYNCICVPICRHKYFHNLYFQCELLSNRFTMDDELVYVKLQAILKPTKWQVQTDNDQSVISKDGEYNYG